MPTVDRAMIEQLRMPNEWRPPQQVTNPFMMGGGGAQQNQFVDPQGMVDPEALQAMAWGTDYDVEARRNAIAARIAANKTAQEAYGKSSGAAGRSWGEEMQTLYGPITRNPDPTSPLIGLMGINPETGPTFF